MRTLAYVCCFCLFCWCFALAQAQQPEETYDVPFAKRLLAHPGMSAGFDEKEAGRLGDRLAIAFLKASDPADLGDPAKLRSILFWLRDAFAAPQAIQVPEDRKPKVTLFLLDCLLSRTSDSTLKKEITDARAFIQQKTAAFGSQ